MTSCRITDLRGELDFTQSKLTEKRQLIEKLQQAPPAGAKRSSSPRSVTSSIGGGALPSLTSVPKRSAISHADHRASNEYDSVPVSLQEEHRGQLRDEHWKRRTSDFERQLAAMQKELTAVRHENLALKGESLAR